MSPQHSEPLGTRLVISFWLWVNPRHLGSVGTCDSHSSSGTGYQKVLLCSFLLSALLIPPRSHHSTGWLQLHRNGIIHYGLLDTGWGKSRFTVVSRYRGTRLLPLSIMTVRGIEITYFSSSFLFIAEFCVNLTCLFVLLLVDT